MKADGMACTLWASVEGKFATGEYDIHAKSCVALPMKDNPYIGWGANPEMVALWNNIYPPGMSTTLPGGSLIQHPVRAERTPEACAELCNADDDCEGFEYGVDHGESWRPLGESGAPHQAYFNTYPWNRFDVKYPRDRLTPPWLGRYWYWDGSALQPFSHGDCMLKSSADYRDCDGSALNLDFYVKRRISCMSGNTGTFKATPSENSTSSFERTVTTVKELAIGDTIEGLDAGKQPALCTVEAIGMFGHGPLYGNYTKDHFVLDPATGNVVQHGAVGKRTVEDKYEVMTSCPAGLDEAGTGSTLLDGDFCGESTGEMAWSDYLLIHASLLRIVRATGGYWFSASAYDDFDSIKQHGPELCAALLACAGAGTECNELERICALFIHGHYLSDDAHEATLKAMPDIGEVGAPGSVSFVVSEGKVSTTEYIVLVAAGVLAGAAVVAALLMAAVVARTVHRRKRSPPTPVTVELEPGTLKLEPTAVA